MIQENSSVARYKEFGYGDAAGSCAAGYINPAVLALAGTLAPGTRVLDMGCGNGALAGMFIERGCSVVGVDLSEEGITIARAAYPRGRFEMLPADREVLERLGENRFDLVVSTEVVEHVYDPLDFLEGCRSALRPDGELILSTPYHGYLKNLAIAATGKFDYHVHPWRVGGHIKFWSRRTLSDVLRQAGFADLRFRGAGRVPFMWKSMVLAARRTWNGP